MRYVLTPVHGVVNSSVGLEVTMIQKQSSYTHWWANLGYLLGDYVDYFIVTDRVCIKIAAYSIHNREWITMEKNIKRGLRTTFHRGQ